MVALLYLMIWSVWYLQYTLRETAIDMSIVDNGFAILTNIQHVSVYDVRTLNIPAQVLFVYEGCMRYRVSMMPGLTRIYNIPWITIFQWQRI